MSDTTRLGVGIYATDLASASIKQVNTQIKALEKSTQELSQMATSASAASAAALQREISTNQSLIATLREVAAAKKAASAEGIRASQQEAEYINRNMDIVAKKYQAEIRSRNAVAIQERNLASDAAQFEAAQINQSLARREAATRAAIAANNARVYQEREAEDQNARAEANYINQGMTASQTKARTEAEYTNRDIDLAKAKTIAEANYINQGMSASAAKARADAEYANQHMDLVAASQRTEAEYINRNADLSYAQMRREADLENQNFNLRASLRAREEAAAAKAAAATEGGVMGGFMQPRMMRHVVGEFDALARGQRGQAISSIGAAARDAGLGVAALSSSMIALVAIMGTVTILRKAEELGEWATKTRAAASAVGMSLPQYSQLQGALTLVGVKADSADTTLRRLAVNLSTALADPTSKVAEAFHNLGISQEQLAATGGDTSKALSLLADAFTRTADGANKSAAMNAIFGRGFENIIPALQTGSAGLEELKNKAQSMGLTLTDETAKGLEETGDAVREMAKTISGDAIVAFERWGPAIRTTVEVLGTLADVLVKIAGLIGTVVSTPIVAAEGAGRAMASKQQELASKGFMYDPASQTLIPIPAIPTGAAGGGGLAPEAADALRSHMTGTAKMAVPPLTTPVSQEAQRNLQMATAESTASKGGDRIAELKAGIAVLQEWVSKDKAGSKEMIADQTALANKQKELNNEMASGGAKTAKQSYTDFASAERLKVEEAQGSSTKIKAIYEEWISAAIAKYHQLSSVVDALRAKELEQVNAAKRGEIMQQVKTDEQAATLNDLNTRLAAFQSGTAITRTSTKEQGPTAYIQQARAYITQAQKIDATYQSQITALKQYGATAEQVVGIETQAKQKEIELYQKAAEASQRAVEKIMEPFTKLFDEIGSEFESLSSSIIKSVISPQITLLKEGLTTKKINESGSEIQSAFRNVFLKIAGDFGNAIETSIGHIAANLISGGMFNTMGDVISNALKNAVTGIFPSLAGSLGGQAAGSALSATTITAPLLSVMTPGFGATVQLLGGIYLNTLAASVKPSVFGTTYASGGIVPSAQGGMIAGGTGGSLAILHAREMVLPAPISMGLQNMIQRNTGGGGPTNNATLNYAPTINTGARGRGGSGMTRSEFQQLLALNSGSMLGEARNMIRNGWRPA